MGCCSSLCRKGDERTCMRIVCGGKQYMSEYTYAKGGGVCAIYVQVSSQVQG